MGLRERYINAMTTRCVVAVPRECNTQQPAEPLRVALPKGVQPATQVPAGPNLPASADLLRATTGATTVQPCNNIAATGEAGESVRLAAWSEAETRIREQRQALIIWLGYSPVAEIAEKLLHRDRDGDDRRLCVECAHAGPGYRCAKREAFLADHLQRCPKFQEKPL